MSLFAIGQDCENIITDYKNQLEMTEKYSRCMKELSIVTDYRIFPIIPGTFDNLCSRMFIRGQYSRQSDYETERRGWDFATRHIYFNELIIDTLTDTERITTTHVEPCYAMYDNMLYVDIDIEVENLCLLKNVKKN